jgi:hypothetical protein
MECLLVLMHEIILQLISVFIQCLVYHAMPRCTDPQVLWILMDIIFKQHYQDATVKGILFLNIHVFPLVWRGIKLVCYYQVSCQIRSGLGRKLILIYLYLLLRVIML